MKIYNLKSNAKINIGLNVVGRLDNGYHLLDMIMVPITLSDNLLIKVSKKNGNLKITTNKKEIPVGSDNIVHKVSNEFYKETKIQPLQMEVYIEKNIPSKAGLGGGSSNGATFLKFLNEFYGNPLSEHKMIEIGKRVGADIPFFIKNKPTRVRGIGELLDEIENKLVSDILLIKPNFGISTEKAYKYVDKLTRKSLADIELIQKGLENNQLEVVENSIKNNLEEALLIEEIKLIEFKNRLLELKDMKFFMSGSGSTYYSFISKVEFLKHKEKIDLLFNDCEIYFCNFK